MQEASPQGPDTLHRNISKPLSVIICFRTRAKYCPRILRGHSAEKGTYKLHFFLHASADVQILLGELLQGYHLPFVRPGFREDLRH